MDLIDLARFRGQVLSLDTGLQLASGNPAGLGALLTLLHPARGSYTCVLAGDRHRIIGQVVYRLKQRPAHLTFLMPEGELTSENLTVVLEVLLTQAGGMGATCVLAELPEEHAALETFRRCGFGIYAWQHVWRMPAYMPDPGGEDSPWQVYRPDMELTVRLFYQSLVPPLVQCSEQPLPSRNPAWIAKRGGELIAYAEGRFGTHGIVLTVLLHPEAGDLAGLVTRLAGGVSAMGRPIYLAVRLYQAHVEPALARLGAEQSPMQVLLARHLTRPVLEASTERRRKVAHARQAEPSASVLDGHE
jgi:hypothetical protein